MKFLYSMSGTIRENSAFSSARALTELARTAEEAGFDGLSFDDHPAPPQRWRADPGGHDCFDPFVALAAVAAGTTSLRLFTSLAVLPYRNPLLLAKITSTLDIVSGGRVELGLGTGYLPDEAAALGVDFSRRNEIFDESLEVLLSAWTGEPVQHSGVSFTACDVIVRPTPVQSPHPPLWIGGNSNRALRRVVRHARGWLSMPHRGAGDISRRSAALTSAADFRRCVGYLRDQAELHGRREPIDILVRPFDAEADVADQLLQLEQEGATWTAFGGGGGDLGEQTAAIARFHDEVIARIVP
ncbi:TIGR03619 family F420-dependent LLM class oxidoreductase [Nocardia fusca]|uniref:TIGR03619 family F420-dependent LLM class oxidoreductase n=1 Tax=Nocardia fusca TaxID=941183 RepID=UPI0037ACA1DD